MKDAEVLRGGQVQRRAQTLLADIPDAEITKPTAEIIAAVKAGDVAEIRRLLGQPERSQ